MTVDDDGGREDSVLQAINRTKGGAVVASRVEWAGTSRRRRRGLLGRQSLDRDEGIYLVPCECVHTFGMRFPIDAAFLDRDGRILAVQHGLKPRRISRLVFRAEGVLELAAGRLRETRTEKGDFIEFTNNAR